MKKMEQVGTVEILLTRTYPLDPLNWNRAGNYTEVIVPPGVYPLYSDGFSRLWVMEGQLNSGGVHGHGDGMFIVWPGDVESGISVKFPSRTYGPDDWEEWQADPLCTEGHPNQRLRIIVWTKATT